MKTFYPNKKISNNINFGSVNFHEKNNYRSSSAIDKIEFKNKSGSSHTKNESNFKRGRIQNVCDTDSLQDQLIKIKQELNKKITECNGYKIEILHLEDEIKKNNKTIEEVLKEVSRVCPDIYNAINANSNSMTNLEESNQIKAVSNNNLSGTENSDFTIPQTKLSLNPGTLMRLKDIYKISHMKKQINKLKITLQMKEEEISNLKSNSKITKYNALENDYLIKVEDYMNIKNSYDMIKDNLSNKEARLKEANEEKEYYKSLMVKAKGNYDEVRERLKFLIEENSKNSEVNKLNEDKLSTLQFTVQSLRFKMNQKDTEINTLREDIKSLENFKGEKIKIEKRLMDYSNTITALKEELEKRNNKSRENEKHQSNLKAKLEEDYESKINVLNKKIKSLEAEIIQYREKVKNLDTQLTLKKISNKNNTNSLKTEGNSNKLNEQENEGAEVNVLKEKLEFESTKNKILEEKIRKLKDKISKLKEKNKESIEVKAIDKIGNSTRIEKNTDEILNVKESNDKNNLAGIDTQQPNEKEIIDDKKSVNNSEIANNMHS